MIYDEQYFKIMDLSESLNEMILNSYAYRAYYEQTMLLNDKEVQQLKKSFLQYKDKYDEVMRFGRYHPDYQEVMLETRKRKKAYDMHPIVMKHKQLETTLQSLLDEVIMIVAKSISKEVKVESGNPFFIDHTCSSNCGCSH